MESIWEWIVAGVVLGIIVGIIIGLRKKRIIVEQPINAEDAVKKQENMEKIKDYLTDHHEVANEEISKLLGVSDSTVVRYMNELEKEGVVTQVGKTGHYTHYEKS